MQILPLPLFPARPLSFPPTQPRDPSLFPFLLDSNDFIMNISRWVLYPRKCINDAWGSQARAWIQQRVSKFIRALERRSCLYGIMITTHESMEHKRQSFPRHRPHFSQPKLGAKSASTSPRELHLPLPTLTSSTHATDHGKR